MEILSIDAGPGMSDVQRCLQDGYSTGGTPGNGLGAVRRLSSRVRRATRRPAAAPWSCRGCAGRRAPERPGRPRHRRRAVTSTPPCRSRRRASRSAATPGGSRERDGELRRARRRRPRARTARRRGRDAGGRGVRRGAVRGAARPDRAGCTAPCPAPAEPPLAVARIDAARRALHRRRQHLRRAGRRRAEPRPAPATTAPSACSSARCRRSTTTGRPRGMLVMHSDGISSRWRLDTYPGLAQRHPAIVAGVLWRDFGRGRDDATIVVVGRPQAGAAHG